MVRPDVKKVSLRITKLFFKNTKFSLEIMSTPTKESKDAKEKKRRRVAKAESRSSSPDSKKSKGTVPDKKVRFHFCEPVRGLECACS